MFTQYYKREWNLLKAIKNSRKPHVFKVLDFVPIHSIAKMGIEKTVFQTKVSKYKLLKELQQWLDTEKSGHEKLKEYFG